MKVIQKEKAEKGSHSKNCKTIEYSFQDPDMDLGVAIISGRYPEKGYCVNLECKELVYVLEGRGSLCFEKKKIPFKKGDSILIDKGEKYYWDVEKCKVSMTCTPAWSPEQYKTID